MSDRDNWMLAKVRALLAKAESTEFPGEAELVNRKAQDLIAKYGIKQAMLASAGATRDGVGDRVKVLTDPYAKQKANLFVRVANPLRVRVVFNVEASKHIKGFQLHMFGFESDIERVEILFNSLLLQAVSEMANAQLPAGLTGSQISAFRRDWMSGFGAKVEQRLRGAEEQAKQQFVRNGHTSTDLVLIDRNDAVERAIERTYPDLGGSARARTIHHEDAFRGGVRAGANADLGRTRIGAGPA